MELKRPLRHSGNERTNNFLALRKESGTGRLLLKIGSYTLVLLTTNNRKTFFLSNITTKRSFHFLVKFELFFLDSHLRITVEMVFDIRSFSRLAVLCFLCQALILSSVAGTREKRSGCGSDLFGDTGIIESPNYPGHYPPHSDCIWHITVAERSRIMLTFQTFQTEQESSCEYDYLEVHNGPSSFSPLLSKLCGDNLPSPIESSGNTMTLTFKSDGSYSLPGFRAEFNKVVDCGGKITSEEGNVTSPNYPQNYGKAEDCLWIVIVPRQYQIKLRFRSLQIEESPGCLSDYVELHDGPDLHFQSLGRFCGSILPDEIRSSGNILTVRFMSDSSNEKRGFSAHFIKVKPGAEELKSMGTGNILLASAVLIILCLTLLSSI